MLCTARRLSYASWRLKVFSQIFLPRHERRVLSETSFRRNFSHTSGAHDGEASTTSAKTDNAPDSENNDANRERSASVRLSQLLPKSPFMNKVRSPLDKERKRLATKEDYARLRNNPWAMALASPPSMCVATASRQPREFLLDFGLIRRSASADGREADGILWWIPVGLWKDELKTSVLQRQKQKQKEPKPQAPAKQRVMYLANRALLLQAITAAEKAHMSLIPYRWRKQRTLLSSKDMQSIVWRKDMHSFVMQSLGKEVCKAFNEASRWGTKEIKPSADMWRAIPLHNVSSSALEKGLKAVEMENMETGGVVILSGGETTSSPFTSILPDYVTLPQSGGRVPVFDLSILLSQSHLEEFRQIYEHFGTQSGVQAWFFRPDGPKSVDAMLALWRLKGYIMYDAEFLAQEWSQALR